MIDVTNVKWVVTGTGTVTQKDFVSIVTSAKVSTHKFIEIYYDYFTETKDAKKAYEKAENLHEQIFGSRRYSSYETFKSCKCEVMKKQ